MKQAVAWIQDHIAVQMENHVRDKCEYPSCAAARMATDEEKQEAETKTSDLERWRNEHQAKPTSTAATNEPDRIAADQQQEEVEANAAALKRVDIEARRRKEAEDESAKARIEADRITSDNQREEVEANAAVGIVVPAASKPSEDWVGASEAEVQAKVDAAVEAAVAAQADAFVSASCFSSSIAMRAAAHDGYSHLSLTCCSICSAM